MRVNRLAFVLSRLLLVLLMPAAALASGPRWVSGPPYFVPTGYAISWYTTSPQYFTDAGDLSPWVNHAAADALVANAAAVWNTPNTSLVLAQGGSLAEHVSAAAIAVTASGLVFPSDVQAANYQNKQIAVIYDTDGSVTDLMLGAGASDPTGLPAGWSHRERRQLRAELEDPARGTGVERPLHRPRARAAAPNAVPAHARLWPRARSRMVAGQ